MKRILQIGIFALFLAIAMPVSAAVFQSGDEYALAEGEVLTENLYVSGSSIITAGAVEGDIFAIGGKVLLQGPVGGDVFSAGGDVDVLGGVDGDIRVVGGQIAIQGVVEGDVLVLGGQIHILKNTTITGDVLSAGGRVVVDGAVGGSVKAYGGDVTLNGIVTGDFETFADNAFVFGEDAQVKGSLTYRAPDELTLTETAVLGDVAYEPHNIRFDKALINAVLSVAFFLKTLMLFVAGLLFVVLFGQLSLTFGRNAVTSFGKNLLIGFILFVVVPALSILLFITFIGTFVGLAFMLLYGLLLVLARIYAGILLGALLSRFITKEVIVDWKWTMIGIVVLEVIALIPFIGGWAVILLTLAALGTISALIHKQFWVDR